MKKTIIVIGFIFLFSGCSNQTPQPILIQPNITIQMPQENKVSDEVKISSIISSEFLERNDIQHYNTEKQTECVNKFKDDKDINIINLFGNSMTPTLWEDNKLICDSSIKDYKSGMIVSFTNYDNERTIHRIKAVYKDYVITQGDNNIDDDGRINNIKIECVVVGVCY